MNDLDHDLELAKFTDALLEGRQNLQGSPRPALAETVEKLAQAIHTQPPPASLRRKIRKQIAVAWAQRQPSPAERWLRWLSLPHPAARPLVWAAVTVGALVVVAIAALTPPAPQNWVGTVIGEHTPKIIGLVLLLIGLLIVGWYIRRD